MYRKIYLVSVLYEKMFPLAHFFSSPAHNSVIVNTQRFVRNHEIFVNPEYFPISLTFRTSSDRGIETERVYGRYLEFETICFKFIWKRTCYTFNINITRSVSFVKSRLYGIFYPGYRVFLVIYPNPVYHKKHLFWRVQRDIFLDHVGNTYKFIPVFYSWESLTNQKRKIFICRLG